jgi:D-methionine transport system substrate-binding protein
MKPWILFTGIVFALSLVGCHSSDQATLKIAATSTPHAEILEFVKPDLEAQGVNLTIIVMDDFNIPNRALADHEVDANFFQHLPFLEAQMKDFNYHLEPLVSVHLEPMGFYSKKIKQLADLKPHAKIALPSDPSNQARALLLLEQAHLIQLKHQRIDVSVLDILANPKQIEWVEVDSPLLTRTLDDVDGALISTNFALQGGLSPTQDALIIENQQSRFANFVVIRQGEAERSDLQALKQVLTTNKVSQWMLSHYPDAVIPAF